MAKLCLIHLADQADLEDVAPLSLDRLRQFTCFGPLQIEGALRTLGRRGLIFRSGGSVRLRVGEGTRPSGAKCRAASSANAVRLRS